MTRLQDHGKRRIVNHESLKRHRAGKIKRLHFPVGTCFAVKKVFTSSPSPQTVIAGKPISRSAPLVPCRANRQTNRVGSPRFREIEYDQAGDATKPAEDFAGES